MGLPANITGKFAGTAQAYQEALANQPILIGTALLAVYIVLGILYESLIHPLTIISTLPSAGVGALMAMVLFKTRSGSSSAMIGIILLIGIVKKNAIMMIDFALAAERNEGMNSRDAIYQACLLRFRPIMMTTMCALLGGMPMALGWGVGAELRKPLGIAIVGGLMVSQMLTLFTTPVIYLYLDRLRKRFSRRQADYEHRPGFLIPGGLAESARLMTRHWKIAVLARSCVPPARSARNTSGPSRQTPVGLQGNGGQRSSGKWPLPAMALLKGKWWEIFGDPQLNALEELVNVNNQNVKQAEAQFRQARATGCSPITRITIPPSDRVPLSPKATSGRMGAGARWNRSNLFATRRPRAWEPDLWGRVRLSVQNAVDNAQVSAADLENIRLSAAGAARDGLLPACRRTICSKRFCSDTIEAYQKNLELTINRYQRRSCIEKRHYPGANPACRRAGPRARICASRGRNMSTLSLC